MKIAVYTTIYPGVEQYLADWYRSVRAQTDQEFQLWIGLDEIDPNAVENAVGGHVEAVWVASETHDTPARIRQRALSQIVEKFDAVILVDSDDLLHSTRVAAARLALGASELVGCALRLVDRQKRELATTFNLPRHEVPDNLLPRTNVFGFSNSAYRSELLRRCLPIPADCVLIDWLLATRAWLMGAKLTFDRVVRMDYRQHGSNTAPVRFPLRSEQVLCNTEKVLEHYRLLLGSPTEHAVPDRLAQTQDAAADVRLFFEQVASRPARLEEYVRNLNELEPQVVWWWDVAHPSLQWMWKDFAGVEYEANQV